MDIVTLPDSRHWYVIICLCHILLSLIADNLSLIIIFFISIENSPKY